MKSKDTDSALGRIVWEAASESRDVPITSGQPGLTTTVGFSWGSAVGGACVGIPVAGFIVSHAVSRKAYLSPGDEPEHRQPRDFDFEEGNPSREFDNATAQEERTLSAHLNLNAGLADVMRRAFERATADDEDEDGAN